MPLTTEQLRRQRYIDDPDVQAPSAISLNAIAASHAVNGYLMSVTELLPASYEPRWVDFHPTASEVRQRVRHVTPRRDVDCSECSGRLGGGQGQRLATR
jgi:hypothetical protein